MYTLFRYENGSNPYIAKNEKEVERMKKKYKDKIEKKSYNYYYIKN